MNKRPLNGADAGADAAALRSAPGSSAVSGSLTVSAPGKVILFGEHAVVYGKRAVAASVGLRTTAVSRADASAVRLVLPDVCLDHSWPLERIRECIAGLVQGASGVEAAAAAAVSGATNAPTASAPESSRPDQAAAKPTKKRRGASGTTVPRRSSRASKPTTPGVDSAPALPHAPASLPAGLVDQLSSLLPDGCSGPAKQSVLAFFTLYALICRGRFGIEVQMESKLPVGAGLGSSASFSVCASATLLLHSGLVQLGDAGAGQTASFSNSQLEVINAWAFLSEKVIHGNPSGIDNSLCTYGGARSYTKTDGMRELKGQAFKAFDFVLTDTNVAKNTKAEVEKVRVRREAHPHIMDPLLNAVQAIADGCIAGCEKHVNGKLSHAELQTQMGILIDMNHAILEAFGVSHPMLEKIRELSAKHGFKSKLTGAGGGGCALTLITDDSDGSRTAAFQASLAAAGCRSFRAQVGCAGVDAIIGE